MKIGICTDTHYDKDLYPSRAAVASDIVSFLNSRSVDFILHLGDIFEQFTGADTAAKEQCCIDNLALYEPPWTNATVQVYWLLGNHDHWGVTNDFFIQNAKYTPSENFIINRGDWRFLCYLNIDLDYFGSTKETLVWLEKQLDLAKLDGKKVIICTHCQIDQFYPGNPARYTSFPYSGYSYNADEQLRVIDDAQAMGVDIRYVFMGHCHANEEISRKGITYYEFKAGGDDGACAVVEIKDDDSLVIEGRASQSSYNI